MEKKLFGIHNVGSDLFDETIEAKMMHSERGEPSPQEERGVWRSVHNRIRIMDSD